MDTVKLLVFLREFGCGEHDENLTLIQYRNVVSDQRRSFFQRPLLVGNGCTQANQNTQGSILRLGGGTQGSIPRLGGALRGVSKDGRGGGEGSNFSLSPTLEHLRTKNSFNFIFCVSRTVCALLNCDPSIINDEDDASNTPLHLASLYGHSAVVKELLDRGAAIDAR